MYQRVQKNHESLGKKTMIKGINIRLITYVAISLVLLNGWIVEIRVQMNVWVTTEYAILINIY